MTGLLGALIWTDARVDPPHPLNLVPAAADITTGCHALRELRRRQLVGVRR
ncbi:hypothetical protein ABZ896_31260 [Streptomyces sp. NPDC047072]|uniref:hypothetical protein n=1 Tax=Streptomyces sp. NPDC047072 TaxID=3154809 RepID=UPI0033CAA280